MNETGGEFGNPEGASEFVAGKSAEPPKDDVPKVSKRKSIPPPPGFIPEGIGRDELSVLQQDVEKPSNEEDPHPNEIVQRFIDEADEELEGLEEKFPTQDEIDRGIRTLELRSNHPFSYPLTGVAIRSALVNLTAIPEDVRAKIDNDPRSLTHEEIESLHRELSKVEHELTDEPEKATFTELMKIISAEKQDITDTISGFKPEEDPMYSAFLDVEKKVLGYAEEATLSRTTDIPLEIDPDLEDPDQDHRVIALDEYLKGKINQLENAKDIISDEMQKTQADAAIAFFGALHDQTF